jgi:hypothetical protein
MSGFSLASFGDAFFASSMGVEIIDTTIQDLNGCNYL